MATSRCAYCFVPIGLISKGIALGDGEGLVGSAFIFVDLRFQ